MQLAGVKLPESIDHADEKRRKLGAQLLLSEVLEYVIHGLGITPVVNGTPIKEPDGIEYQSNGEKSDSIEMVDGLADVAYTMYWNSEAFGVPLKEAFELVCDNNLEKFILLNEESFSPGPLPREDWHCAQDVSWPPEVESVTGVTVGNRLYAVGKDANGKVRKPSHYQSVNLKALVNE